MRSVTLKGRQDDLSLTLGQDTALIEQIMTRGRYIPELIYEWEATGAEVRALLRACGVDVAGMSALSDGNTYVLTAYDW